MRTLLVATTTGAAGIMVFAGVQDLHISCYHLGGVLFLAILTFPTASLETTLDIDLTALPQVLVTDLRQLTPHNNAMPLCFFLVAMEFARYLIGIDSYYSYDLGEVKDNV